MRRRHRVILLVLPLTPVLALWPVLASGLHLPPILKGYSRFIMPTITPTATTSPTPGARHTPLCSGPQPPLVTDFQVRQVPDLPEPQPRVSFRDPVLGTCLVHVTDRSSDLFPSDTFAGLKNEYSRVQSFNADGSRILVRGIEATWYLYDADTLQPLAQLPLSVEPRWHPTDPNLVYHIDESRLLVHNVRTGEQAVVHDFAQDFPGESLAAVWTRYEGSPSMDGRYWGLMAENQEWEVVAYLVYDRLQDQVIARRDTPDHPEVDSVTISPLGTCFLAYRDDYCPHGQLGTEANPCGLMVYDRNLTHGRGLLRIVGRSCCLRRVRRSHLSALSGSAPGYEASPAVTARPASAARLIEPACPMASATSSRAGSVSPVSERDSLHPYEPQAASGFDRFGPERIHCSRCSSRMSSPRFVLILATASTKSSMAFSSANITSWGRPTQRPSAPSALGQCTWA